VTKESAKSRLSAISTRQTELRNAYDADPNLRAKAREAIIYRYQKAIQRYLRAALQSPTAAEELFQRFAVEFLSGRLQGWNPARGRFRYYLKAVLIRLVNDYRKERRYPRLVALGSRPRHEESYSEQNPLDSPQKPVSDRQERDDFDEAWRDELLAHTWAALSDVERESGQPFFTVLRLRATNPKVTSTEIATRLTEQLKPARPFTDTGIRKTLERAREKFANLLIDEVGRSLAEPTLDELEQELIDLRLLGYHYCRDILRQRRENR
jgi:DNA-directed RNA polymerase specialized sigma24 family protein